jgi:hypothetical protein
MPSPFPKITANGMGKTQVDSPDASEARFFSGVLRYQPLEFVLECNLF